MTPSLRDPAVRQEIAHWMDKDVVVGLLDASVRQEIVNFANQGVTVRGSALGFPLLRVDSDVETLRLWLQTNDPNGCYTAENCAREYGGGITPPDLATTWMLLAEMFVDDVEDLPA